MTFAALWSEGWTAPVVNHLWQSTAVVAVAWALALALRRNHARVRYWVWMTASVKFLLPFSMLIAAREWLRTLIPAVRVARPALANWMAPPLATTRFFPPAATPLPAHNGNWLPLALLVFWAFGALAVAIRFGRGWWSVYAARQAASPLEMVAGVPVLATPALIEPGVFGIFAPVLLLPAGILGRLTAEQMQPILTHEMCHVRRRDNLTFAIHMLVETLFWFHPAVWWIGTRLIEEREQACDEAVVQAGGHAEVYAQSILNVCIFYVESPLPCAAGVTGADLKRRIARIMAEAPARRLTLPGRILMASVLAVSLAAPLVAGLIAANPLSAQLLLAAGPLPSFEVATIKPDLDGTGGANYGVAADRFSARNVTVKDLIGFAYKVKTSDGIEGAPKWAGSQKFDVSAKISPAESKIMGKLQPSQRLDQFRLMMQSLLAQRFGLMTSTRTRNLPVYTLVVARNGPKLTAMKSGPQHMPLLWGGSAGEMHAASVTMPLFADWISGSPNTGGRAVIDRTGLKGSYDFTLKWTRAAAAANTMAGQPADPSTSGGMATDETGPSFFTALREQLGLKLVAGKAPVQVLAIEHIGHPTPN
jgi:bla regulator protein BlaR1